MADILYGKVSPSAKLSVSYPNTEIYEPICYNYSAEKDPRIQWPFGYGLSYTTFEYRDFQLPSELKAGENLKVKVTVTNTGSVAGDEVVQLYAHDELASVARPLKQMVAFKRVTLDPGESREVELEVPYRQFGLWDQQMRFGVEEGWFEMWLGRNANDRIDGGQVYVK